MTRTSVFQNCNGSDSEMIGIPLSHIGSSTRQRSGPKYDPGGTPTKDRGNVPRSSLGTKPRTTTSPKPRTPRTSGFTLIELLIVVAVLGILMGAAVFSLNPASDQRALQGFAQRIAQRIELARDRAIQNNQEWGLYVQEEGYRVVAFDDISGRWIPQQQKPFQPDEPPSPVNFKLTVQEGGFEDIGAAVFTNGDLGDTSNTSAEKGKDLPDVVFFSSGEASQFFIDVQFSDGEQIVRLSTDGFSPVRIQESDALAGGFR